MQFQRHLRTRNILSLLRIPFYTGLLVVLLCVLSLSTAQEGGGTGTTKTTGNPAQAVNSVKTDRSQLLAAAAQGNIRLIVGLDMDTFTGKSFGKLPEVDQFSAIQRAQSTLLSTLALVGVTPSRVRSYTSIPYLALTTDSAGLKALTISPLVDYIQLDGLNFASLDESTVQIGAAGTGGAWEAGYDGTGQTIAILDSGVDKTHQFLAGKVVSEACYSTTDVFYDPYYGTINIVSVCPGGQDTTAANSGLNCNAYGCEHGTHVAGIAAGHLDDGLNGVAKGANLIAIQIFSKITNGAVCSALGYGTPCITAFDSDIIGGLDRVYALRSSYHIAAVNMSLGGGQYFSESTCNAENQATKAAADRLLSANIAVVAASGNNGFATSMSAPACISGVVSVGAVNGSDYVVNFSNEAPFLDLLAPGVSIYSSVPGNDYESMSGTSMAAPHVAGAWAILKQFKPSASVASIEKALEKTGPKIQGWINKFPRIQVNQAILYLTKPGKAILQTPVDQQIISTTPVMFSWNTSDHTDLYSLVIKDEQGATVVKELFAPDSCVADVCSYTLNEPLTNGVYSWYIKTYNQYNESRSGKYALVIDYPGAPTLQQPADGTVLTDKAQWTVLQWSQVDGATDYKVAVKDNKTKVKFVKAALTSADCVDGLCTYTVTDADREYLRNHRSYKWSVQASNSLGISKSVKFNFSISY